jgi:hypothetical protein
VAEMRVLVEVKRTKNKAPSIGYYKQYTIQKKGLKIIKVDDILNEYFKTTAVFVFNVI